MSDSASMDLSQFHGVFFEEAAEHLANMEMLLLELDLDAPDAEQLNAIFRAAHSIKGGAGTFGFAEITDVTHEMETVFDRVRKGEMPLNRALVDVFLASGDMVKGMLAARQGAGEAVTKTEIDALCVRLRAFLEAGDAAEKSRRKALEVVFGPMDETFDDKALASVVGDLKDFGEIAELPGAAVGMRRFRMLTDVSAEDMRDALGFMVAPEKTVVTPADTPAAETPTAEPKPETDPGFGLFEDVPAPAAAEAVKPAPGEKLAEVASQLATQSATHSKAAAPAHRTAAQHAETSSIRVSVEKVDQLINLVGELVITQSMLAQTASKTDPVLYEALNNSLAHLERNTRDLQEAAMSIRMMPMSFVFSRFPRVIRDLAGKLGKEADLKLIGEHTELDKGLIERIVDPLTHLVRNSIDHGIELPADREAAGKPRRGSIVLSAYHQGGNIVIEVSDDGKGLSREKLMAKARERGIPTREDMSDTEVWNLIFEAGFSTAEVVTDVSGRGVGMDVVRRNIEELGGRVDIASALGSGTRMTIRLPLTLAILDGMSVRVGDATYIIPLACISESLQPQAGQVKSVRGDGEVIEVRGEYLPTISLDTVFGNPGGQFGAHHASNDEDGKDDSGLFVIIETNGRRTALRVDELLGQHQVVIKSLEANYRRVPGVSGATIMGDGRVALILDTAHLLSMSHPAFARAA